MEDYSEHISQIINREVEKLAQKIALILERSTKEVIAEHKKVATGDLYKSIRGDVKKEVDKWIITCYANTNYAVFVHEGTKPHWAPIYPLFRWVRMKKLTGNYSAKTGRRLGNKIDTFSEDMILAKRIQRAIAHHGTKGLKFFELALKQAMPQIQKEIEAFNV